MTTEEQKNENMEQNAMQEAMGVAKGEVEKRTKKIIIRVGQAIATVVAPMLLKLLELLVGIMVVIGTFAALTIPITGSNSGQTEDQELEKTVVLDDLGEYLVQFSTVRTDDGSAFYKMKGDTIGLPTIGDEDICWKFCASYFDKEGYVSTDGINKEHVENVRNYVREQLGGDETIQFEDDSQINALNIYIEKALVMDAGKQIREAKYQEVVNRTSDLDLSKQQLWALTELNYAGGFAESRAPLYKFIEIYKEGAEVCEVNSWKHMKYIWDNYWYQAGTGLLGIVKGVDATFETYVKGTYDFPGETIFERTYFDYYTQEQLNELGVNATSMEIKRTGTDEEYEKKIFTYNENN